MKIFAQISQDAPKRAVENALLRDVQTMLERLEPMLLDMGGPGMTMSSELKSVISSGGKRLRPILAYIGYRMGQSTVLPILPLMCMLELMHTTSLIHDDVVDGAWVRRGISTINATKGAAVAVQSGDYLLARAMEYLKFYKGTGINELLIQASEDMCLGELRQLKMRYEYQKQTTEIYFSQIKRKTASLLAASCMSGGIAGGLRYQRVNALKVYGEKLGIAFQLCDDLLDFSEEREFGKEPGQDLQNGIFTLPVLELLDRDIPVSTRELLLKKNKDKQDVKFLIDYVRESKALDNAKNMIRSSTAEAVEALSILPRSAEKSALIKLAVSLSDRHI